MPPQAARYAANTGAVPKGTPVVYLDMQRDGDLKFLRPGATFNEDMANPVPPQLLLQNLDNLGPHLLALADTETGDWASVLRHRIGHVLTVSASKALPSAPSEQPILK